MTLSTDIAIVGAGVIGMAIAERLTAEGREVLLIDPNPPGSGASYGNAGTIADYAVQPVGTPDVLKNLPSLLFDRDSPLAIRQAALPSLVPWLLRFARQSLPSAAQRNARAIAGLLSDAGSLWADLAERIGATELIQHRGCLYIYEKKSDFDAAARDMDFRKSLGIAVERLGPAELQGLEPNLKPVLGGAAYFPKAMFLSDPVRMMAALNAAHRAQHLMHRVETIHRDGGDVILRGYGLDLRAKTAIIATGAHSRHLARQLGDRIPLDTERGYHVEWDMPEPLLSRPCCPTTRGFYLCPMEGRLRVAGTVELGGLHLPPSPHRVAKLIEGARAMFPHLGEPSRSWMGFRPSLPDSLPVISASSHGNDVIYAFGHGHIGLTLAPVTAALVTDLVFRRPPRRDLSATRVGRF